MKRALILAIVIGGLLYPHSTGAFACQEDVNIDGRVNLLDVQVVASHWRAIAGAHYDQDANNRIDVVDVERVAARLGSICSGSIIGNCPVFPANNVWNTRIDSLPVDSNSPAYVNNIGATAGLHPDFGSGLWNGGPIGIPYTTVPGTQPLVTVSFDYADESDPGPYPIPPNPPIEGGSDSDGDRHVLVVDTDHCKLYEMWNSWPQPDGSWYAGSGAVFDLTSNALRPAGWTSADAAGLPILPGLVRYDEVAAGAINHALRFTAPRTRRAYIWPARHYASSSTDPTRPPMGQRFRLKASFDISGFSPTNQVILTALKTYGMFLADNGSSWYLSGVPDERWDNDDLHQLQNLVHGSDFEAVDESALMLDPDSGQVSSRFSSAVSVYLPVVTRRWGAHATAEYAGDLRDVSLNGLYPDWTGDNGDELIIRSGGGFDSWALLYFDVSNPSGRASGRSLPAGTVVRSARLRLSLFAHVAPLDTWESVYRVLDPDGLGLWSESQATFNARRPGVPWSNSGTGNLETVIGPELDRFYLGNLVQWNSAWAEWDVTQAVRAWVANPITNQGLLLPHVVDGLYTAPSREHADAGRRPYLEITYEGPNPDRPAQVTGVQAVHRAGQTFITWNEIGSGSPEERYRIYRHTAPITADNLDQANLLAEVPAGSGYYAHEAEGCSAGVDCSPIGQSRFVIEDDGAPLPEGAGLFVYTVRGPPILSRGAEVLSGAKEQEQESTGEYTSAPPHLRTIAQEVAVGGLPSAVVSYYAVTSVVEGNENRDDFVSNVAGPLTEVEATPRPVRVWTNATNTGWVYTQFMDYHHWNPDLEGYAYNFYVGVPAGYDPNGDPLPLLVQLHAYTGTYRLPAEPGAGGTDYGWPVIQVLPDDRTNTWWFGFGQNVGTNQPLYTAPIVDYTHQRLDAILDFVRGAFNVDESRIYLFGGSMGGSGTLNYGLRRRDVFAAVYAESGMTNFATAGDAGGAAWEEGGITALWGTVEQNLPTNLGLRIWDWYNLQSWVQNNPGAELPFLADHHGRNDDVIDWETQGAPWYQALEAGRHGCVGVFDDAGHSWPGFVADSSVFTLTDFNFRRDESFPALSNASNSDDPATSTGCRNCRVEWSSSWNDFAGLPVDRSDRYEVVLRTTDGAPATVDITPRRLQTFRVMPGAQVTWENRRVGDNALVIGGTVSADGNGLVTIPNFAVSTTGNRLILQWACPADITGNGSVDVVDVQAVAGWWQRAGFPPEVDVNDDDVVDIDDIMAVAAQWGVPCGSDHLTPSPSPTGRRETATPTATLTPSPSPTGRGETATLTATPTPTATPTGQAGATRPLPDTTQGIYVWNDQLATWDMTEAQFQFAATHYVGSQKIIRSHADRLRSYNPDFLILHYRLGAGLGYRATDADCNPTGDFLRVVEGDQWVQEWPGEANVQGSWFFPFGGAGRVLQCTYGWYLMNLDDAGWRTYWVGEVMRQLAANDDDAVFADSLSVPNYLGADTFEPDLPAYDLTFENAWAARIENWIAYVKSQFGSRYRLIPNVGQWVTTRDPTDYSGADGVMIEGFAEWDANNPFDLGDWQLQMNRILGLERQGKVIIAQNYLDDASDVNTRMFYLANYLLVKGSRTYINIDMGLEPEWFPEYEIGIGAPTDPLPTDVDAWRDPGSGLYRRTYTHGLVVVNPTDTARTLSLGGTYYQAIPSGGGWVPSNGDVSSWHVDYTPVTSLTLPPNRGAVLLTTLPP